MSLYRSFLWWLLLAALGALAWDLLQPDFGEVVIRWHGTTITTTVAFFLFACILLLFSLWLLWYFAFPTTPGRPMPTSRHAAV
jgi:Na+/proline symporter